MGAFKKPGRLPSHPGPDYVRLLVDMWLAVQGLMIFLDPESYGKAGEAFAGFIFVGEMTVVCLAWGASAAEFYRVTRWATAFLVAFFSPVLYMFLTLGGLGLFVAFFTKLAAILRRTFSAQERQLRESGTLAIANVGVFCLALLAAALIDDMMRPVEPASRGFALFAAGYFAAQCGLNLAGGRIVAFDERKGSRGTGFWGERPSPKKDKKRSLP